MKRLDASFYERPSPVVARDLLGRVFFRTIGENLLSARIVEVEAYCGREDPASHSYRGRTPRNDVMFGPPGRLYVYFIYGMHFCMNVVTGGEGEAVLLRAMEAVSGESVMLANRKISSARNLLNGPARCAQAFDVDLAKNGASLLEGDFGILPGSPVETSLIETTPRIGITKAADLPLRFFIRGARISGKT